MSAPEWRNGLYCSLHRQGPFGIARVPYKVPASMVGLQSLLPELEVRALACLHTIRITHILLCNQHSHAAVQGLIDYVFIVSLLWDISNISVIWHRTLSFRFMLPTPLKWKASGKIITCSHACAYCSGGALTRPLELSRLYIVNADTKKPEEPSLGFSQDHPLSHTACEPGIAYCDCRMLRFASLFSLRIDHHVLH